MMFASARGDYKLVKLPKQKYEELESAIRKVNMAFPNAADCIHEQYKQKRLLKLKKFPQKIEE